MTYVARRYHNPDQWFSRLRPLADVSKALKTSKAHLGRGPKSNARLGGLQIGWTLTTGGVRIEKRRRMMGER